MNTVYAASEGGLTIHMAAPVLGYVFGIPLTSTMLTVWLTIIVLVVFALVWRKRLSLIPGKTQVCIEAVIGGAFEYVANALENREHARKFFPLLMTIFIFILALNWVGLLPIVNAIGIYGEYHGTTKLIPFLYPANTDLNITIGLAIVAFLTIEIAGIALLGLFPYIGKFINFSSPLNFLMGIIELFSELARLISFSFRLFGNIFAGKTLLVVAMFFVPIILPVPLLAFELFVGFIQAFIFAVLTLFFIKLAIVKPSH